ncbi:MAG: ATP-binding cassette domain-containing protein [Candidatus Niameybacter stercoravium]|nr:ATP-binding cassette domain-containing protein [Candidatus Niameybacter stercoravium]
MIEIKNLSKMYKGEFLYRNFNCAFEENKVNVILGSSGSGKTTLFRMMLGLEKYDSGQILGLSHEKIAVVFQEDRLVEWMNVYENVAFVLKSSVEKQEMDKLINKALELVELIDYVDYSIKDLSGGMQRRVALARAIVRRESILFMDEPFKGLDDELRLRIITRLKAHWRENGTTVFLITHNQEEGMLLGDIIYKFVEKPVKFYKI